MMQVQSQTWGEVAQKGLQIFAAQPFSLQLKELALFRAIPEIIINGTYTETQSKLVQKLATDIYTEVSKNTTLLKQFLALLNDTLHSYYEKNKQSVNESFQHIIGLDQTRKLQLISYIGQSIAEDFKKSNISEVQVFSTFDQIQEIIQQDKDNKINYGTDYNQLVDGVQLLKQYNFSKEIDMIKDFNFSSIPLPENLVKSVGAFFFSLLGDSETTSNTDNNNGTNPQVPTNQTNNDTTNQTTQANQTTQENSTTNQTTNQTNQTTHANETNDTANQTNQINSTANGTIQEKNNTSPITNGTKQKTEQENEEDDDDDAGVVVMVLFFLLLGLVGIIFFRRYMNRRKLMQFRMNEELTTQGVQAF